MSKVILLDFGIFSHRAIYAHESMPKKMPIDYICLNMMISSLRRIGVEPQDLILVACDGRKNWRKDYEKKYKANRKKLDDEKWRPINKLLPIIKTGTTWHLCHHDKLEADDWMAIAPKYFKDKEVIIVSYDEDLEQCWHYPNVKIFSIMLKFRGGKGAYKIPKKNFNVYDLIIKKVQKETSDNLTDKILIKEDYELRKKLISLLDLPDWIEEICVERFQNLKKENVNLKDIYYSNLREKIGSLYNEKSKIVTYEDSVKRAKRKKRKKKKRRKKK